MLDHLVQGIVRVVGVLYAHNLDFIELMHAIKPAHIFTVATGLSPKAGRVAAHLYRQVGLG